MKWIQSFLFAVALVIVPAISWAASDPYDVTISHRMTVLVLELAVIIIAARATGYVFVRYLKQPAVLGELCVGMVIGPYALGGLDLPIVGQLFSLPHGMLPISPELYGIATVAFIVLLFLAGLETDLSMLLRFSVVGIVVGICGAAGSFLLGDMLAVWFGIAPHPMHPAALFLGAISMATSVGITARILSEKGKIDSPEGATILTAAVLDDVLGVVILAIVVGIAKVSGRAGDSIPWGAIVLVAAKAFGFWIVCTAVGLLFARRITRVLKWFRSPELIASMSLGLALFLAGLSEMAGLAMVIGAYIMGLTLSHTDVKLALQERLRGMYDVLIPIFFCTMGMLVNFREMKGALIFGAAYTAVAVLAKIVGCSLPALGIGFNMRGAIRIGIGMLPRGEVTLIIAGIGLATHAIGHEVFGIAIMMIVVTTLITPPLLVRAFEGPAGVAKDVGRGKALSEEKISIAFPTPEIAEFVLGRIAKAFEREAFFVHRVGHGLPIYQMRQNKVVITLFQEGSDVVLETPPKHLDVAQLVLAEEMMELEEMFESIKKVSGTLEQGKNLFSKTFAKA